MHASHSIDEERKIQIRNRNVCHRMLHQYFDIHTMRVRQPSKVLPMNIYAFQIKSHRCFIFSFTPSFGQFGWSALLMLNLYAVCVRFAWFYLTVAKWKILYQLDWFVFFILYHVWKTNDAHIFHTGIFSLHFTIVYQQLETGVRFAYLWNVCSIRCVTIWWLWLFDWGGFVLGQGSNAWYHRSTSANVIGFSLIVCVHVCSQRQRMIIFPVFCSLSFLIQYSWTKSIVA